LSQHSLDTLWNNTIHSKVTLINFLPLGKGFWPSNVFTLK
jgi:hypothetical protein